MGSIEAIFFDFDDTLSEQIPFNLQYVRAIGAVLAPRYGGDPEAWAQSATDMLVALEADYVARFLDRPLNGYCDWLQSLRGRATALLFQGMDLPLPEAAEAVALDTLYKALAGCSALFPGARDAVQRLHALGHTLYMSSGNDSDHLRAALAGAEIDRFFVRFYGPDLVDCAKEGQEFYRTIFEDLGLLPRNALVVDNDPKVIAWAAQVGARTIQVKLSGGGEAPTAPEADAVATHLDQLTALIANSEQKGTEMACGNKRSLNGL